MKKPEHEDPMLNFQALVQALKVAAYLREMDDDDWDALTAFIGQRMVNLVSEEAGHELNQMDDFEQWIPAHDEVGFKYTSALLTELKQLATKVRELWQVRIAEDAVVMSRYKAVN